MLMTKNCFLLSFLFGAHTHTHTHTHTGSNYSTIWVFNFDINIATGVIESRGCEIKFLFHW